MDEEAVAATMAEATTATTVLHRLTAEDAKTRTTGNGLLRRVTTGGLLRLLLEATVAVDTAVSVRLLRLREDTAADTLGMTTRLAILTAALLRRLGPGRPLRL
jgi:hypothetical protein